MLTINKPTFFTIDVPTFKFGVDIWICSKEKAYKKFNSFDFDGYKVENLSEGRCLQFETYNPIVWVNIDSVNPISVLVHELLHAIIGVMEIKGIKLDVDNDEVICYLQEFVFTKCLEKIDIKIKK